MKKRAICGAALHEMNSLSKLRNLCINFYLLEWENCGNQFYCITGNDEVD